MLLLTARPTAGSSIMTTDVNEKHVMVVSFCACVCLCVSVSVHVFVCVSVVNASFD